MPTENLHITPKLGEGIYLVKDVAKILHLDYDHVRRWILGYWDGSLKNEVNYAFGEKGNKAINFYSLIEFYVFYKLREKGIGASTIRKLHETLSEKLQTLYPFAIAHDFYIEKRKYKKFVFVQYLDAIWKFDGKNKLYLNFIEDFLEKIEFGDNNIAKRFFPLGKDKSVVVDPVHQFGQPTILGTNIKTQTLYNLYKGGETYENIGVLYNLPIEKVKDAIHFQNAA